MESQAVAYAQRESTQEDQMAHITDFLFQWWKRDEREGELDLRALCAFVYIWSVLCSVLVLFMLYG